MAWYGSGGWSFRPYVSVAEKKEAFWLRLRPS
jgi:hypothetical protein